MHIPHCLARIPSGVRCLLILLGVAGCGEFRAPAQVVQVAIPAGAGISVTAPAFQGSKFAETPEPAEAAEQVELALAPVAAATEKARPKFGLESRQRWTTSRVVGSPDPPPKYATERLFGDLKFDHPTVLTMAPGLDRWFLAEHSGKVYSFVPGENPTPELFVDLSKALQFDVTDSATGVGRMYGLTFHPNFAENRLCYVCYTTLPRQAGTRPEDGTRVSEFRVSDTVPPQCLPETERRVISWLVQGHNGGCLKFGPDGYLYVTSGDGSFPNPPDERLAGQDVTNLLSAVMRIDVDHPTADRGYTIPADNPFVDLEGARGEIWAYGFRNPWKISFDRKSGQLWLGDVGWEQYEMIHLVERGGNYGWSVQEGSQPVRTNAKRGPTPIRPAAIELPHSLAASVTGGYVYHGKRLPELQGAYLFGDWETRRMWSARFEGAQLREMEELVEPTLRLVAMAEDHDGELYFVDYDDGTIHQLVPNTVQTKPEDFPHNLSETGLFKKTDQHTLAGGVIPFSVNAPLWADHATAEYLVGVPEAGKIGWYDENQPIPGTIMKRQLVFPTNSVLAKTYSMEMEAGKPESRRRIETQLLHYNGRTWIGYSYRWNDDQSDAQLVDAAGAETVLDVTDPNAPGGIRRQTWAFHGRATCVRCHNPWAQHTLAFNIPQLNRNHAYGSVESHQLATLLHAGLLERRFPEPTAQELAEAVANPEAAAKAQAERDALAKLPPEETVDYATLPTLANPYDPSAALDHRARSYLHANCAHCHQMGAGGTADIELRTTFKIEKTKALDAKPLQGTFGIANAAILSPGDPYRSLLYFRMAKLGRGRMPHVGSEVIDEPALELMQAWIRQLPIRTRQLATLQELIDLDEAAALVSDEEKRPGRVARLAQQFAKDAKRAVSKEDQVGAERLDAEHAVLRATKRMEARETLLQELIGTPDGALFLSRQLQQQPLPEMTQQWVLGQIKSSNQPTLQGLFETLMPSIDRPKRLGTVVDVQALLAISGDAQRGEKLFAATDGIQCKNCHRIGKLGKPLGPDLDGIGKKYDRAKLLEAILEPSKTIDTRYMTFLLQTASGRVISGLMHKQDDKQVVLRDAKGELVPVATEDVELLVPQRKSLMPDLLLRDMTVEQVADLLAYLATLRKEVPPLELGGSQTGEQVPQ